MFFTNVRILGQIWGRLSKFNAIFVKGFYRYFLTWQFTILSRKM